MNTNLLTTCIYISCLTFISNVYADDCDSAAMVNKLTDLESKLEYKNCEFVNLLNAYHDSSHDLVQILNILKDTYEQSLTSAGDDLHIAAEVKKYRLELEMAKSTILGASNININSSGTGLTGLAKWAKKVHKHLIDPMKIIGNIPQDSISSADQLTICKANFQLKKTQKWRNRILNCISQVPGVDESESDNDSNSASIDANDDN